jgi:hypothetical protein
LSGASCSRIGRVDTLGALDPSFAPGANSPVYSFALQTDGRLLLGGSFTTLANQSINRVARIDAAGNVDPSFSASASATVFSVVLQSDGNILAGGAFTTLDGQSVPYLGRLVNTEPATTSLDVEGNTITWLRGGTCPEVSWTTFESSQDGNNWTSVGFGSRVSGGWQLTGVHPPATGLVRARGRVNGGAYLSGSSWLVESVVRIGSAIPLSIVVNDRSLGFASNHFGFNITGTAGQSIIVEASPDLANWIPVATNLLSTAPLYFSDQTPKSGQRFYRARLLKP